MSSKVKEFRLASDLVKCMCYSFPQMLLSLYLFLDKSEAQAEELKKMLAKLEHQTQTSGHELLNMKKTLCDAETRSER